MRIGIRLRAVRRWKSFREWLFRADSNHVIAVGTVAAAIAAIFYTGYAAKQLSVMRETLNHITSNDASSSTQTDKIVTASQDMESHLKQMVLDNKTMLSDSKEAIADTLNDNRREFAESLAQNREATGAATKQGGKTLDASIEAFRTDQRAWLTIMNVRLVAEPEVGNGLSIVFSIQNTGKTPAVDAMAKTWFGITFTDPIAPDWNSIIASPQRKFIVFPNTSRLPSSR
jgi:subtilase family serine protease